MAMTGGTRFRRAGLIAVAAAVVGGLGVAGAFAAGTAQPPDGATEPALRNGPVPKTASGPASLIAPADYGSRSSGSSASVPQIAPSTGGPGRSGAADSLSYGWGGCPAPLEGVLKSGKVDPGLGGFPAKFLGDGFVLSSLAMTANSDCGAANGGTGAVSRSLNTVWIHTKSGAAVNVAQRAAKDPIASVLNIGYAQFWRDGYVYDVSAYIGGAAVDGGPDYPSKPIASPPLPGGQVDVQPVIEEAIAQLAPDLKLACFYRQENGDWADLKRLGIGDPRGAVPAGYKEIEKQIMSFKEPAAGCNTLKLEGYGAGNVSIAWGKGSGMILGVHAFAAEGPSGKGDAQFGQGYASWTNGTVGFGLNWDPQDVTEDAAKKLARALDPAFDQQCFVGPADMTDAEFTALGVRVPTLPDGFRQESAQRFRVVATGACKDGPSSGGFHAQWLMVREKIGAGGLIQAAVFGGTQPNRLEYIPNYENQTLYWTDDRGYSYYVAGFKGDFSKERETLLGVAKSMDLSFSESRLKPPPEPKGIEPLPALPPASPAKPPRRS